MIMPANRAIIMLMTLYKQSALCMVLHVYNCSSYFKEYTIPSAFYNIGVMY